MSTLKLTAAVSSDKGLVRGNNEDNFNINGVHLTADNRDLPFSHSENFGEGAACFAVFDGMGGESYGEEAALICAENLTAPPLGTDTNKHINNFVTTANDMVCAKVRETGVKRIGATAAILCVENGVAKAYNVGDSRIYLQRNGKLEQVSLDHSVVQRKISQGLISKEEARSDPARHKITQYIGIFPDEMTIEPFIAKPIQLEQGDKLVLCTDGLTDMVTDEDIKKILTQNKSAQALSKELKDVALSNGGKDNVTVIVVSVEDVAEKMKKVNIKTLTIVGVIGVLLAVGLFFVFGNQMFNNNEIPSSEPEQMETRVEVDSIDWAFFPEHIMVGDNGSLLVSVPVGANVTIEYLSNNSEIIAVDRNTGDFRAINPGDAIIIANAVDNETGEILVTIDRQVSVVPVIVEITNIVGVPQTRTLTTGETHTLNVSIVPENATDRTISYSSSNPNVANVNQTGVITARNPGTTTIVVMAGSVRREMVLTVNPSIANVVPPTNINAPNEQNATTTNLLSTGSTDPSAGQDNENIGNNNTDDTNESTADQNGSSD